MSTTDGSLPRRRTDRKRKVSKAAKVGWGIYQQIAAAFAAFGVAAMLGHFWDIGWRGFLGTIVGVWEATVRPATEWVFHVLITMPLSWAGINFETPLLVRDYVAVGIVIGVSYYRTARQTFDEMPTISFYRFETWPRWFPLLW